MNKILLIILFNFTLIIGQSVDATMTIYKNRLALIKQPVSWVIENKSSEIEYGTIPEGIKESTPYLNLSNGTVLNQKLNKNIFYFHGFASSSNSNKAKILNGLDMNLRQAVIAFGYTNKKLKSNSITLKYMRSA